MFRNFVIVEPDPVVRLDLRSMLTIEYAGCTIVQPPLVEDAVLALENSDHGTTVIVRGSQLAKERELARAAVTAMDRGCRLVAVGAVKGFDDRAIWVDTPFSTDTMCVALRGCAS